MFSHRPQTPSGQNETGAPAAHSPVLDFKTPESALHLPRLPQLPHLPGQSPGQPGHSPFPNLPQTPHLPGQSPSPQVPALPQLPAQPPIQTLPAGGDRKGLRRRLKLEKLPGAKKLPVSAPLVGDQVKVSKRARLNLFVTKVKLRLKGVKTPSTALVTRTVPSEGLEVLPSPAPPL